MLGGGFGCGVWGRGDEGDGGGDVTFFVMADPQIHLEKWGVAGTEKTIEVMNGLPGSEFPTGGLVDEPLGVLVLGDLVDDVRDEASWETYQRLFDPEGGAELRHPVIEGIGNHDLGPASGADGFSVVELGFIERNKRRGGGERLRFDGLGYHSSWDWEPLHLVQLNLFPGNEARPVYDREAPWNDPRRSLDFLREDLEGRVGESGRPVVLMWHYGLRGWGLEKWWTEEDLERLKEVIEPYQVVLILHGHEHSYARYEWEGYPVFMCPSPQRDRDPEKLEEASEPKGFLVVRLRGSRLEVVHWRSDGSGAGEVWEREISVGG